MVISERVSELTQQIAALTKAGEIETILERKTMYARFREMAEFQPDAPAVFYAGENFTYREILEWIDIAAKGFAELGIGYGDAVTFSALGTPYSIVALYALDKLGAFMHMVNCISGPDEIKRELSHVPSKYFVGNDVFCSEVVRQALADAGVTKIVTISLTDCIRKKLSGDAIFYTLAEKKKGMNKKLYDGKTILNFGQLMELGRTSKLDVQAVPFVPNKRVAIAYTSGSTGDSKACVANWEGLDSMVQIMAVTENGRFARGDVLFATFPLWIYYSLLNMIHEPLCLGAAVAFDPLFDPKNLGKRNKQYHINHWLTIPPYLDKALATNKKMDCSKWKIVLTGGAALPNDLKLRADEYIKANGGTAQVQQGYGANEMLGSFAYGYYPNATLGSLGKPCIGNWIKILDVDTGKELGPNEVGAGYLYSPTHMMEYYGDPEATAHNLVTDENGTTWYFSEDLMHVNEQGEIFLDGRIRRIALALDANGNPTKIIPERTRKAIEELAEVDMCEVITVPHKDKENVAVAFVVLKDGDSQTATMKEKVVRHCVETVPEYMVPVDVHFIPEMPLTPAKKPDLKKLLEIAIMGNRQFT